MRPINHLLLGGFDLGPSGLGRCGNFGFRRRAHLPFDFLGRSRSRFGALDFRPPGLLCCTNSFNTGRAHFLARGFYKRHGLREHATGQFDQFVLQLRDLFLDLRCPPQLRWCKMKNTHGLNINRQSQIESTA